MKYSRLLLSLFLMLSVGIPLSTAQEQKLAEIYKSGRIRFVQELIISEESLKSIFYLRCQQFL